MSVPLSERDDRELMRAHVAGDPDAFGELFRRHRDRMWAVALRTTGNRELASDCVQDAFISAFRRAESYRGDAAVTTWLHRIVVNACLDRLRRDKPTSELPERELSDRRDAHAALETRLDVREALDRLPEGQRMALVLVWPRFLVSFYTNVLVFEHVVHTSDSPTRSAFGLFILN